MQPLYYFCSVFALIHLLRFVAALLVLLFHLELFPSGYKGVDVFFAISGFVMYYSLFYKDPPKWYRFAWHRLTKIFGLYWLALPALYFLAPFELNLESMKSIFLVPGHTSLIGVSWSLSYELYFYVLVALAAYFLPRYYQLKVLLVLFLVAGGITIYNTYDPQLKGSLMNFLLGAHFWQFSIGIFAGYMAFWVKYQLPHAVSKWGALASFILLLVLNYPYQDPRSYLVYGLVCFFLIWFTASIELQTKLPIGAEKLCIKLGDLSYAMYLFGPLVALLLPKQDLQAKLVIVLVTICVSIVLSLFIEKPLLKLLRFKKND